MIYASFNWNQVPENIVRRFAKSERFGYELVQLSLRAVCDSIQDRDSMYSQAKDAHLYVATVGPRPARNKKWYGVYW